MEGAPPPLILAYHAVADVPLRDDPHALFVRADDIRRHIAALRGWGYGFLTFGEMAEELGRGPAAGRVALTFDDGFADNLHALGPVLASEGVPATVFVVSRWLGRRHPVAPQATIVTGDELRELHASGVEIGGHTATHPDLVAVGVDEAREELRAGREDLEDLLGSPVTSVAYPFGRADAGVRDAARAAGFVAGCRTCGEGSWADPLDLPRQDMTNRASMLGLRLKRDDRYEKLVATLPGRAARRLRRAALTWAG